MGMTKLKLKISNPRNNKKSVEVPFLVDSGATHSFVDRKTLKKLGIKPTSKRDYYLANGESITRDLGIVEYKYGERETQSPVVFAEEGDMHLLGVVTLENLGLGLNPIQRTLVPLEMRA